MVEDEDPQMRGLAPELLLDPRVAAAADLAVVEIGLGRVDGDDGDPVLAQDRVAVPEEVLEVDVADVAGVVVPGTTTNESQLMRSRYERATWYSCLNPKVVRSPEQITTSGSNSFTSEIARSRRFASKYGPPQWRSERWAMRNRRSPSAIVHSLRRPMT